MTIRIWATAAFLFGGTALADIPPPEPENPLAEACQPFMGVWTRDIPQHFRQAKVWVVMAVGSEKATLLHYANQENVNLTSDAREFTLTCTPDGANAVKLVFMREDWGTVDYLATPLGEDKFTTTEMSQDLGRGAPDPNFTPQAIIVTWTRIAR